MDEILRAPLLPGETYQALGGLITSGIVWAEDLFPASRDPR
jgi:hypothetical protein